MALYNNFIGIDIGKFTFVTAIHGKKETKEYKNNLEGITSFIKDHQNIIANSLCIVEATGGYEINLLITLCKQDFKVHRANTRKVKNFIRSLGNEAKTDVLDARFLALYGFERSDRLELFQPQSTKNIELRELVQRRSDLKQILVAEKNRLQSPKPDFVKASCNAVMEVILKEVTAIDEQINLLISENQSLQAKKDIIKTVPGIGNVVANELLIMLPELGTLDRRKIASLAGLAPKANDSGTLNGYRRVANGRNCVKPILFLAAMAARNSKSVLRTFYEKLIARGKKKMVALTALMRKIIVIANAKLRYLEASSVLQKI